MEFIFERRDALTPEFCDEIIKIFKDNKESQYDGVTYAGLDDKIKKTRDLMLGIDNYKFKNIINFINDNLMMMIKEFFDGLYEGKSYNDFSIISDKLFLEQGLLIQHYEQNLGKFIYHNDWKHSNKDKSQRILTFIYYLNTVEEGGETEFFGGTEKIKPEKGKLVFFPATWTYPHRGNIPISSEKYIITGWLHQHYEKPKIKFIQEDDFYNFKNEIILSTHNYPLFLPDICTWILSKIEIKDKITRIDQDNPVFIFIVGNIQSIIYKITEIYKIPEELNIEIENILILKDTNIFCDTLFYSRIPLNKPINSFNIGECILSTNNIIIEDRKGIDLFIIFTLKGHIIRENTIVEIIMN